MEKYQPKGKVIEIKKEKEIIEIPNHGKFLIKKAYIDKRLKYLADAVEITERGERNGRLVVASGDFSDFWDGNWFYWRFEPEEEGK